MNYIEKIVKLNRVIAYAAAEIRADRAHSALNSLVEVEAPDDEQLRIVLGALGSAIMTLGKIRTLFWQITEYTKEHDGHIGLDCEAYFELYHYLGIDRYKPDPQE